MAFSGEYRHQLDAKNRMRLPAKLKSSLGENYYFTKGKDGCISVLPESTYNAVADELSSSAYFDAEAVDRRRYFFKSVFNAEEDNQGRVLLPQRLREFAKITKDIVVIGSGNSIEIWSAERYDEFFDDDSYDSVVFNSK